jgi:hypothetical protein
VFHGVTPSARYTNIIAPTDTLEKVVHRRLAKGNLAAILGGMSSAKTVMPPTPVNWNYRPQRIVAGSRQQRSLAIASAPSPPKAMMMPRWKVPLTQAIWVNGNSVTSVELS